MNATTHTQTSNASEFSAHIYVEVIVEHLSSDGMTEGEAYDYCARVETAIEDRFPGVTAEVVPVFGIEGAIDGDIRVTGRDRSRISEDAINAVIEQA